MQSGFLTLYYFWMKPFDVFTEGTTNLKHFFGLVVPIRCAFYCNFENVII